MKNHAPEGYICPICLANQGIESGQTLLRQEDLIFKDDLVCGWLASLWVGKNEGHVIIVPNQHFETLYDLPRAVGHRIFDVSQQLSLVLKNAYQCDGVTLRQNNEPAADQHAFHYHLHIFPRYENDDFNQSLLQQSHLSTPTERQPYSEKLKTYLQSQVPFPQST